ncbi:MAG: FKBP-type peptidyl-prolyl cis-trans isomerase [Anaerolineae bacterium]
MKQAHIMLAGLLATGVLAACGPNIDYDTIPFDVPEDAPAENVGEGLVMITLEEGDGISPVIGDEVVVNYTGRLNDGTEFDSSLGEDREPFQFVLGYGQVIQGWEQGINEMNAGDRVILVIPSELGYGELGSGQDIPPNATLYFEVELLEVNR